MCLFLPPACVLLYGRSSAPAAFQYDASCWCISMPQSVHHNANLTGVGVCCSPRPAGHSEFCKYSTRVAYGSWPPTASSGRLPERGGDGTPRRVPGSDQPQSSIRRRLRHAVRGGSGPPSQPGQTPPYKGTDDNRTATALGDVAWAAAGVLEPQGTSFGTVALWDPSRCQCLSVVRSCLRVSVRQVIDQSLCSGQTITMGAES